MKTIQSKLIVVLAVFLVISIVGTCITVSFLSKQKDDGVVINLAGKQRMLTQKMSKESIALSQGTGSKESLEKTVNLFDRTLKGLISGDTVLGLPPTQNIEIVKQLNHVRKLWKGFRVNQDVVLANAAETTAALSYINDNNITLLKEMNKAVGMMDSRGSDPVKINLAGKQRMLTQKMTKEAIALSQGLGSSESLEKTANLFDKTLKGLISGDSDLKLTQTKDQNVLSQLNHVKELWKGFRTNLDEVVANPTSSATALSYLNDNNLDLLKASHKVVTLLVGNTIDPKRVNLAGKQRMLTQKMVKETLGLVQGGVDADTLKSTSSLFDKTLKGLISGDSDLGLSATTDSAILAQLTSVQRLWKDFNGNVSTVLRLAPVTNNALAYINGHNVELLKEMNKAVGMYEKLSKEKVATLSWISILIVGVVAITAIMTWFFMAQPLVRTLKGLIENLTSGSEQIACATEEIASASQNFAQGSSEQASSLEETSASMEQMASVTKQNSTNAEEAAKLVDMCSTAADNGNSAVRDMSNSMEEINTSSKKIAEITKVIDGIAFQTNLLALNAAVEAARAGEHGKGFAVVAEEVRNLAQRSATAAKDTTALIDDCVAKANNGAQIAGKGREALKEIVNNVNKVNALTKEIENASVEQSGGIDHVGQAVQQIDQVTQQNAASAEETASASEELAAQSLALKDQVKILAALIGGRADETSDTHKESPVHTRQISYRYDDSSNSNLKGNGHGTTEPEVLIPMGENRIEEHSEHLKDF